MRSFTYVIKDEIGIHARPAGLLAQMARKFTSNIFITYHGKEVDCRKLMSVMSLGVKSGDTISVSIDGEDEAEASAKLMDFFRENL